MAITPAGKAHLRPSSVRREFRESHARPPPIVASERGLPGFELLRMENTIVIAAPFSPLQ